MLANIGILLLRFKEIITDIEFIVLVGGWCGGGIFANQQFAIDAADDNNQEEKMSVVVVIDEEEDGDEEL